MADGEDWDEDFDEDEGEGEPTSGTLLGFLEPPPQTPLVSSQFPSKVGGRPVRRARLVASRACSDNSPLISLQAWLNRRDLPKSKMCARCGKPLRFLLQVYAPRAGETDANAAACFHRTVFLFVCNNGRCLTSNPGSICAFRSQLPQNNSFYPATPPGADAPTTEAEYPKGVNVCAICGLHSEQKCSRCKGPYYCSRDHQLAHWRAGHKKVCCKAVPGAEPDAKAQSAAASQSAAVALKDLLFPEGEIVIEDELACDADVAVDRKREEELLEKYQNEQKKLSDAELRREDAAFAGDAKLAKAFAGACSIDGQGDPALTDDKAVSDESKATVGGGKESSNTKAGSSNKVDFSFERFRAVTKANPHQVLRYSETGGRPLWVTDQEQLDERKVPLCRCGKRREFEFQVLPQLLNHLNVDNSDKDALDWGTLAVYTCPDSCGDGTKQYFEEYAYCQPIVS